MTTKTATWTESQAERKSQALVVPRAAALAEPAWLLAALAIALLSAARAMAPAFGPGDVVQDDARQHLFWMARFRDPELFQDDLLARYFEALAPPGFKLLYRGLSLVVEPVQASKLLPPVLGVLTALFTFLFVRRLHPSPACAFLATVLLSWYIWQQDHLASATPRAFILPLIVVQVWALSTRRDMWAIVVAGVAALLYSPAGVLALALLGARLVDFNGWKPFVSRERSRWLPFLAAAALVGAALLPPQLATAPFGPTVSVAEARAMPEFGSGGKHAFFTNNPYRYWISSGRSGLDLGIKDALFPTLPILVELLALAGLLPVVLLLRRRLRPAQWVRKETTILIHLLVASFGLFFLAHALLFRLYFPSRFVRFTVPLVLAVAAGLALGILIEAIASRIKPGRGGLVRGGLALIMASALALYPASYDGDFKADSHPSITAYLRQQPKDTVVAGVPSSIELIPALAERRILVGRKFVMAVHLGYHREIRQRTEALVRAYYSESDGPVRDFMERYGVDVLLVSRTAFDRQAFARPDEADNWEPYTSSIARLLERRTRFALLELASRCAVVDDGELAIVPRTCLSA